MGNPGEPRQRDPVRLRHLRPRVLHRAVPAQRRQRDGKRPQSVLPAGRVEQPDRPGPQRERVRRHGGRRRIVHRGQVGEAASFDAGDGISVSQDGDLTDLTDFTATAWFRSTEDDRADQVVFGIRKGYELVFDSAGQRVSDNSVWWAVDNGTGDWAVNPTGAGPLALGEWHHAALVQNTTADEVQVYIDGSLVVTDSGTGAVNGATGDFGIGVRGDGFGQFVGDIDDVRIYSRALSASEVQSLYDSA
ncbi:LamG domain-containing protein [Haloplanus litoreus]|uniref:LamG domain-containing protein n=1 Tax=Haloplanus litoreus TaxID=767515 RepID=UPI003620A55A